MINIVISGPQPADKSFAEIERYIGALKQAENESCYVVEDRALAKQSQTMKNDIVF